MTTANEVRPMSQRFVTQNGWTKARMIEAIWARNKGRRAALQLDGGNTICQYRTVDGNRCAVGVFVPDADDAERFSGAVSELLAEFPRLLLFMPLTVLGLHHMQSVHDMAARDVDPRPLLTAWIHDHVADEGEP